MSWHKEIRAARNWQELLSLARDFVAKMTPDEVATLPANCREIRIKGTDDVFFWHERLAEEFFARASRDDPSQAHRELLDFFTMAAERASEIAGKEAIPGNDPGVETPTRNGKRVLH